MLFLMMLLILRVSQRRYDTLPTLRSVGRSEGFDASLIPYEGSNGLVYESAASQPVCQRQRSDSVEGGTETLATLLEKLSVSDEPFTCAIIGMPTD